MFAGTPRRAGDAPRRGIVLAGLAVLALLLHAGFLGGLEWQVGAAVAHRPQPPALQVRVVPPEPVPVAAALKVPASRVVAPAPASRPQRAAVQAPEPGPAPRPAVRDPVAVAVAIEAEAEPTAEPAIPAPEVAASPPPEPGLPPAPLAETPRPATPGDRELPVYRTVIPPAVTLRYQLRRGLLLGEGELQWAWEGNRYDARLEGRLAGITVLTQTSQGGFDEAGVAPLRFTDQRLTGGLRATNFQREVGKITFSGPTVAYPLLTGSQDRLSWMIQLAAVVGGEPQRLQEGGKVVIHVVGARGDARLWVFRFVAQEEVTTVAGKVQGAKFVREATDAYDTQVEVWLDPLRHYLPARAILRAGPDDEGLELLAQDPVAVP